MNTISIQNVSKSFGQHKVLDNINLNCEKVFIYGIVGHNGSGKTVLFKSICGFIKPDSGVITINGKPNLDISKFNLGVIIEAPAYISELSGIDNLSYLYEIKNKKNRKHLEEVLRLVGLDPLSKKKVSKYSMGMKQRLAIAQAIMEEQDILILDEPTSSLTENEVKHLFKIIRKLQGNGIGIVYISHKMEEITEICDEITILRDGKWVTTEKVKDLTTDQIINLMVGRDLTNRFPDKTNKPGEVILEVEHLTAKRPKSIEDVSFTLRKGEILGIAGLVGSKRTDIVETLFGVIEKKSGTVKIDGKEVNIRNPKEATKNGLALITEERRATGIYSMLDIKFNSIISNTRNYKALLGLLDNSKIEKDTKWVIDSMHVKTPSQKTHIGSLSGGNQQKVIIGRWLLTAPEILLMDEPTRGIDVGAKFEIYQLMINLAEKEKGIIMISSEMPELLGVTDRILVMSNGRVAGIVNTAETSQEEILKLTAKYL